MNSYFIFLPALLLVVRRSSASYGIEEPTIAVEPAHVNAPLLHAHVAPVAPIVSVAPVAPVVASLPAVPVAPTLDYAYGYNHPYSEAHNVAKSYAKETGHVLETAMVSGHGHPHGLEMHAPHLANFFSLVGPWRPQEPTVDVDPEHIHLPVAHTRSPCSPPAVPVSPVAPVASAVALPEDPALDYSLCRHGSRLR
ncbi:unnamed protein product [Strongylus vulgaris]|uniref:SCP domain-containing protein n=1 Tax=Strongylus vulgaris TaxID=40348 RepID=A0A3P7JAZ0_STRVU|nr:unnamed protein product [Strongylus vulgaris]